MDKQKMDPVKDVADKRYPSPKSHPSNHGTERDGGADRGWPKAAAPWGGVGLEII
jgi:hypothetical protein